MSLIKTKWRKATLESGGYLYLLGAFLPKGDVENWERVSDTARERDTLGKIKRVDIVETR